MPSMSCHQSTDTSLRGCIYVRDTKSSHVQSVSSCEVNITSLTGLVRGSTLVVCMVGAALARNLRLGNNFLGPRHNTTKHNIDSTTSSHTAPANLAPQALYDRTIVLPPFTNTHEPLHTTWRAKTLTSSSQAHPVWARRHMLSSWHERQGSSTFLSTRSLKTRGFMRARMRRQGAGSWTRIRYVPPVARPRVS